MRRTVALALVLAAGTAHADYRESYSRGLAALKDGNNAEARKLFEQALAEQPEPALRVRLYGQRWEPYLPQHYLGAAAFALGDCATALAQWNSGPNQQITSQLGEIRSAQQRDAAICEQKAGRVAQSQAPAPAPIAAAPAPEASAPVETRAATRPGSESTKPVASTTPAPAPPQAAAPPRAERAPPEKKAADATRPPQPLIDAYDRYLAGRYAEVGRIDPDAYADARARFHAYLVRSAARFTLGEISGDKDLLDAARSDARAARALDARRAPDATLFSPRFRAFFRES